MSFPPNNIPQWVTASPGTTLSEDNAEADGTHAMGYPFTGPLGYFTAPSQFPVLIGGVTSAGPYVTSQAGILDPLFAYGAAGVTMPDNAGYQLQSGALLSSRGQNQHPIHLDDDSEVHETEATSANEDGSKKREKKRPPRKYTAEQLAKRREQNRKAQRTYRDRKDQRIKELEDELAAAAQHTEMISSAIDALKAEYESLTGIPAVSMPGAGYTSFALSIPTTSF